MHVALVNLHRRRSGCTSLAFLFFLLLFSFWFTFTKTANDSIRSVLTDNVWRVNHVELFCGILASECQNRQLAPWMLREEACDIENLTCDNHPTVSLRRVLGDLVH